MVDGIGTTKYTYSPAGQLLSEDGPFASDIVTNGYSNRLRTRLSLQQPTGFWTNGLAYDSTKRLTNVISPAGSFGYLFDPTLFTHHASLSQTPPASPTFTTSTPASPPLTSKRATTRFSIPTLTFTTRPTSARI
jgi:hypothetical protein